MTYSQIVVQCEASIAGDDALRVAVDIARGGGRVTVVVPVPLERAGRSCCGLSGAKWNEYLLTEAGNDLEEARHVVSNHANVDFLAVPGAPVAALIETARRLGAGLIITPGRPPRALCRRAPCAVLHAGSYAGDGRSIDEAPMLTESARPARRRPLLGLRRSG